MAILDGLISGDKFDYIRRICFNDSLILVRLERTVKNPNWKRLLGKLIFRDFEEHHIYEVMIFSSWSIGDGADSCYTFRFYRKELKHFLKVAKKGGVSKIFFNGQENDLNDEFIKEKL